MREPRRDEPTETFGSYVLFECLGRGGMATVHRAKQTGIEGFEKIVVLKRILPHLSGEGHFVEMFLNEGRIAAQLAHPNVCQVHDLGEVDGELFLVMEYLEGVSWEEAMAALDTWRAAHPDVSTVLTPTDVLVDGMRWRPER